VLRYGLVGVVWAFLAARGALVLLAAARLRHKHGLRIPAGLLGLLSYIGAALVLGGLLGRGEMSLSAVNVAWRLGLYGTLTAGTWLFLTAEEKAWLRSAWKKIREG
jgi:hypothetical protein